MKKLDEKNKEIRELKSENEKLIIEKDHIARMQSGLGMSSLRRINAGGGGENRYASAQAKKRDAERKKLLQALDNDDDEGNIH